MWNPSLLTGLVSSEKITSKANERPNQRRRWNAISEPRLPSARLEPSPARPSHWNASTQVPSEPTLLPPRLDSPPVRRSRWDVSTQHPSGSKSPRREFLQSRPSLPSRIAGGSRCDCGCAPTEREVESCLPGLHQKYVHVYEETKCVEGHLPRGYRKFVEHDDLYLPPSRPLSPATTDHDDLYLPLKTCDSPRPDACSCIDLSASDPTYGAIYLPPSRPCTPVFKNNKDLYCSSSQFRPAPPSRECFGLGGLGNFAPADLPGLKEMPNLSECICPAYIKKLVPPRPDCSCSPYIKKLPACPNPTSSGSFTPSPPPSPLPCSCPDPSSSAVYIAEVPAPPAGSRYIPCNECLCHKDQSTRSLCPSPTKISSPCRDCVCHLGSRSPSQGASTGCGPNPGPTRCQTGFKTPSKPRLKLQLSQSQCLECKSPYSCKGPPNCNPQYIVETPLSPISVRSRSPSPGGGPGSSKPRTPDLMSSSCQSCDCHKAGGINSCSEPPKVSPTLFDDPCCSPRRPVTPCRSLLAAEMLSGIETCASGAKASSKRADSCLDPRCASCECHKPKVSPCLLPKATPSSPCSPCRLVLGPSSCSPCSPPRSNDSSNHIPTFKNTSPRCSTCDCHKPKSCKLSTQICKSPFCRRAGQCNCNCYMPQLQTEDLPPCNRTPRRSCPPPVHSSPCCVGHGTQHQAFSVKNESCVKKVGEILVPRDSTNSTSENTFRYGFEQPVKLPKVESLLTCNDDSNSIPRAPSELSEPESVSQLCCCGRCHCTEPRFPIKTRCPFCKNVHLCCCGMCTCPISTCSSKLPLSGEAPTPRFPKTSDEASRGVSKLQSQRPKSATHVPRSKVLKGLNSPEKSPSKLPFARFHLQDSGARWSFPSPRTRMKLNIQQTPVRR